MMNVTILVDDSSVDAAIARLERLLSPQWISFFLETEVQTYLKERVKSRFDSSGDDASGQWAPLAPATPSFREAQGYDPNSPINIRSREMIDWITKGSPGAVAPLDDGAILRFPGTTPSGELGKKFTTAQRGKAGVTGQRPTPPRPVVAANSTDLLAIMTRLRLRFWGSGNAG